MNAGRGVDDLLHDLLEAMDAAAELVQLGKDRWDDERPLRLAGEAVIGRLGDIATKLPGYLLDATPEVPWDQIRGMRIIVDHAYHRINYERVWATLRDDVPGLALAVERWRTREQERAKERKTPILAVASDDLTGRLRATPAAGALIATWPRILPGFRDESTAMSSRSPWNPMLGTVMVIGHGRPADARA